MRYDVIIIGGSYSGLAAGLALGRSLKNVLIIDSGKPCNRQTPQSHNFITHDGRKPAEISRLARLDVEKYDTVRFVEGVAVNGQRVDGGFSIALDSGETFSATKLIFASGIRDIMPAVDGFAECWGVSVLHCPYCHGYEVRGQVTGLLANGDHAFDFSRLLSNWTKELTLYTNGASTLTSDQAMQLGARGIAVVETPVQRVGHEGGYIHSLELADGARMQMKALYAHCAFEQHCTIPAQLGVELADGYIKVDMMQKTSLDGVYACGDSTSRMRSVAAAVAQGTMAGAALNREMIMEGF